MVFRQLRLLEVWDEDALLSACLALGASSVGKWSAAESRLTTDLPPVEPEVERLLEGIQSGNDPLGDIFCTLRSPAVRRGSGATYTPLLIVQAMVKRAKELGTPVRVVDVGCGSARFLVEAGRAFDGAELIGVENDPVAAILARANLATVGFAERSSVLLSDFRLVKLPKTQGPTLYIGNPPYVRHHLLPSEWKEWLAAKAAKLGHKASQLAGLHVYFFLATALNGQPGDVGTFITAAEWLDVNYGSLVRELFLNDLGGTSITVVEPTAMPFPDAATTGVVTTFTLGAKPDTLELARIEDPELIAKPPAVRRVSRARLEAEHRWSHLTRGVRDVPSALVELGELCRVHRGAVTGANRVWIASDDSPKLPASVLFASVTKARELIKAGLELIDASSLRCVIDLPEDLDELDGDARKQVERFLRYARTQDAHSGYIARNRKAWWSVGLRAPAPILATYMARRSPSFVRNRAEARHINIAHGLYPRLQLTENVLQGLVRFLSSSASVHDGRTYAGGLTKFEPREMERLLVPRPEHVQDYVQC